MYAANIQDFVAFFVFAFLLMNILKTFDYCRQMKLFEFYQNASFYG